MAVHHLQQDESARAVAMLPTQLQNDSYDGHTRYNSVLSAQELLYSHVPYKVSDMCMYGSSLIPSSNRVSGLGTRLVW